MDVAGPLLGVNDEDARGADGEVVDIRAGLPGHGQVVENHVAVAGEPVQQPGGLAFAVGAALPGAGLLGGVEAQPPADQRGGGQPGRGG